MLGSLDHLTRQLIVHTSPTKRSSDFIAHLEQLERLFGPQPGHHAKPVVLVEDNGPIHTSKRSLAALAARAHWSHRDRECLHDPFCGARCRPARKSQISLAFGPQESNSCDVLRIDPPRLIGEFGKLPSVSKGSSEYRGGRAIPSRPRRPLRRQAGARPIAPNGCGRDDAAQPPNRGRVMTFAFFRFQELPIGDALCDGEAEIWFDAEFDAIDYAAVTRAVDPDLGEAVDVQFSEAEVIAALLQHRRGAIESAIADAEHGR